MPAVITFPPIGTNKFILTRYDVMLYINFVNEVGHINKTIGEDQKDATNDLADWIDNPEHRINKKTFEKMFTMIDFVNKIYETLIEDLRTYRFENMEIIQEQVEKGEVTEGVYYKYCKHLKELWERIDEGLYKVWFERRGAVLKNYKPSIDVLLTMVRIDSIEIKIIKKIGMGQKRN
jgi:hypothetical protein